ncbi:MAG: methionyl-tRNA formyltransferase [Microbacteriaceae bacterium]|jgi:methionyl-tRNA formyltransferase|nr:methionyl-tRNA formyltransferase [Microbacteriaceae bacterium]
MADLEIVFAGSPAAAVPSLQALTAGRHDVLAVLTREDSPQGRKRELAQTAVADAADVLALPVIKANRLAGEATERLMALQPDLGVIVAYGGLVREPLLSAPRLGWINLHFSLLPRWRGAAPVQRAIMAGDDVTGASVFQLVPELDAGELFGQVTQSIGAHETAGHLLESLSYSGAELLVRVVDAIADGAARGETQVGDVTLAPKLGLEDGRIDWTQQASQILNLVRGVTPEPGAFTTIDGQRLKVLEAVIARDEPALAPGLFSGPARVLVGTASDPIELLEVHPAGKRPMRAADWWRGRSTGSPTVGE